MGDILHFRKRVAAPFSDDAMLQALARLIMKSDKAERALQVRELRRSLRRGDAKIAAVNPVRRDHSEAIANAIRLDRDIRQARARSIDAVVRLPTW